MKTKIIILLALVVLFTGCEDLLTPANENNRGLEDIYEDPAFAEGLLLNGYVRLPSGGYSFNDVATDDAVSNNSYNGYLLMATGKWSALNNPVDKWTSALAAIQYLNIILTETDKVEWAKTGEYTKEMFNDRIKGESYGLRALFMYYLLQAHGGLSASGELLGVPILTEPLDGQSDFNLPRNTFEECVKQIYNDLELAESYLPLDYEDVTDSTDVQIPSKYAGKTTISDYNRVFGAYNHQRLTARIVKGIRAQVALLAASPAFSEGSSVTWADAANAAGEVLDLIGGVSGMASNGGYWYAKANSSEIGGLALGVNPPEVLWRTNVSEQSNLEEENFPPSLYGNGRVNPTQNLVDAFPMANGYPITDSNSGYDANNPYADRDPRLNLYIVVNGSKLGNSTIYTKEGKTTDGIDNISTSTRTGYYLRKLLREDVNLNPTSATSQKHYVPRIRYTEIFLTYAEAANEAWGPDDKGSFGFSARDVISAIRQRAGIAQPDNFLASVGGKDDMRKLIHNERRLELCFEGFRFWDLRRWKENITEPAKGMLVTADDKYVINTVEKRQYNDYMYYGPLPYSEVLKWGLTQNAGW
ncbi:MAG: RagB/SusD family nutrient uptake outer membrane protein [Prolixibacteraceae bacterium]|nr:RagB/SusD family nutrient uptake outer membrane protein [Prolixibacteraceae bacterium]